MPKREAGARGSGSRRTHAAALASSFSTSSHVTASRAPTGEQRSETARGTRRRRTHLAPRLPLSLLPLSPLRRFRPCRSVPAAAHFDPDPDPDLNLGSDAVDEPEGGAGCSPQEQPTPPLTQVQGPDATTPLPFDDDLHFDAVCGCDGGHVVAPTAANGRLCLLSTYNGPQRTGALIR